MNVLQIKNTIFSVFIATCIWLPVEVAAEVVEAENQEDSLDGGVSQATGIISGRVVDADTGAPLFDVTVGVGRAVWSADTDLDGRYILREVTEGTYKLLFSKPGYHLSSATEVVVVANEVTRLDFPLRAREDSRNRKRVTEDVSGEGEDLLELDEFTVSAKILESSRAGLIGFRQKAAAVSDAIGADEFSEFGLGDAAVALTKVTGVSITDGKYVVIRGLGDRYANTNLNGSSLPNPDPNQQTAQLDLFPTILLDTVVAKKTFTPDQPGNTSGGSVNMKTKAFPEELVISVSGSFGYDESLETGSDFLAVVGQNPAFWANDAKDFATYEESQELFGIPSETAMSLEKGEASGPRSFSFAFGNTFRFAKQPLGIVVGFSWDRSFDLITDAIRQRFTEINTTPGLDPLQIGTQTTASAITSLGGQVGLSYKLGDSNEVRFNLLHIRSGEYVNARIRTLDEADPGTAGVSASSPKDDLLLRESLHYTERELTSYQVAGKSVFPFLMDLELDWSASWSSSVQEEPDLRQTTILDVGRTLENLEMLRQFSSRRLFRHLEEDSDSVRVDFTLPARLFGRSGSTLKAGFYHEAARHFHLQQDVILSPNDGRTNAFGVLINDDVPEFDLAEVGGFLFVSNVEAEAGLVSGERKVLAGYFMTDLQLSEKLRMVGGVRLETTAIHVEGRGILSEINLLTSGTGEINQSDTLPAVSAVYELGEDMNLRIAYSRTLARPSFRELGPYFIRNFSGGDVYEGNPNLTMSGIQNIDVRWEWFRSGREFYSLSFFRKAIDRPIEQFAFASLPGTTDPSKDPLRISYTNNPNEAEISGFEAEMRTGLGFVPAPFFKDLFFGANFTYIDAQVGYRQDELRAIGSITGMGQNEIPETRRLQDQPEWIMNANLQYRNLGAGTNLTLAYYLISDELKSTAGINTLGTFSDSYHTFDIIASQRLWSRWKVKLTAKNLTDPARVVLMDPRFNEVPLIHTSFRRGRTLSVAFSYDF